MVKHFPRHVERILGMQVVGHFTGHQVVVNGTVQQFLVNGAVLIGEGLKCRKGFRVRCLEFVEPLLHLGRRLAARKLKFRPLNR